MAESLCSIVQIYKESIRSNPNVPRFSYGRRMLRDGGGPIRLFFTYLFINPPLVYEFLKEVGFIRSRMACKTCGEDMTWSVRSQQSDGFQWRCQRRGAGKRCNKVASIRTGSRFQRSNLSFLEILLISHDFVCRGKAHQIGIEYSLGSCTVTD
jgi:hypothetical protein